MGQSLGPIDLGWAFKIRAENKEGFTLVATKRAL